MGGTGVRVLVEMRVGVEVGAAGVKVAGGVGVGVDAGALLDTTTVPPRIEFRTEEPR